VAAGERVRMGRGGGGGAGGAVDGLAASRVTFVGGGGEGGALGAPPGALTRGLPAALALLADGGEATAASRATAARVTNDVDGLLFTAKNLLVLREQLSPFAATLTSTTQSLDWRATASALSALVAGGVGNAGALLSFSAANPLLAFLQNGMPTVAEARVDFKAHLEALLKGTCEAFISRSASLLVGGVAAWAAARAAPGAPPALDGARFAADAAALLEGARRDLLALLPPLRRRLGLYLGSPLTASILFAPVRDRAALALLRVRELAFEALGPAGGEHRAAVEAGVSAAMAVLEASDAIIVDPASPGFGYDDGAFQLKAGGGKGA
jgi:hypothetical protein